MEDQKNGSKIFSTILLSVGVLFIVVSGGIFVSQTWRYLPDVVKKLCLAAVTAGFFGGSVIAERNELKKAGLALYYLGACFTGLTTLSFLGMTEMENAARLLFTMLAVAVPVGIRFARERKAIDLILEIFLCDGMILCIYNLESWALRSDASLICLSTFTMALAGLIYYCRKTREDKGLLAVGAIAFGLHLFIGFWCSLFRLIGSDDFFFGLYPVIMLAAAITVVWLASEKNLILRLLQSGALGYLTFATVLFIFRNALPEFGYPEFSVTIFATVVITLILAVVLKRLELLGAGGALAVFCCVIQVLSYIFMEEELMERMICHPYAITFAIALAAWKYFHATDLSWKKVGKLGAALAALNLNVILAFCFESYRSHYGVTLALAGMLLLGSFLAETLGKVEPLGEGLRTMALVMAEISFLNHPVIKTTFEVGETSVNFGMEYCVIFLGLGIVLLGIIWYDMFEKIWFFQFLGTCLLMAALVLHNLAVPALPNVMFLGGTALVMLLVATMRKNKHYAILAAATLILVALYLTREVWMSIAWWVYLFVAGVGLVIFAIKKEKAEK